VAGAGFANQVVNLAFVDSFGDFSLGTQYQVTATSDTDLTSTTVPQNPAIVDVEVCTVTACSSASSHDDPVDEFILYPPGNPKIDSIKPKFGPANGGTAVTITGENLGCVTGVWFGKTAATKVSNRGALLDCGSTTKVTVVAPPGTTGTSVRVTLTTVESDLTGFGRSSGSPKFTYTQPPKQLLTVNRAGNGAGTVTSTPAGIRCASASCSHRFPYGSVVTLTAKPAAGSRFAGWLGPCSGTKACKVTLLDATLVRARFTH
jgi:hypothetical protein